MSKMTRDEMLGYVGKRVTVCWVVAANIGRGGGRESGALTGRLEEVGEIAWFAGCRSLPVSWITSIALAEPDGKQEQP